MIERCCNPKFRQYADYGGRGIAVCDRWRKSFAAFLADMGQRPNGTTLGRKESSGNYEPGNCRWETDSQQARNRRDNRKLTYEGKTKLLVEWAEEYGLNRLTLYQRLFSYGWDLHRSLTTPVGPESKNHKMMTLNGKTQCLRAWAVEFNISEDTLASRLKKNGGDLKSALEQKNRYKNGRHKK